MPTHVLHITESCALSVSMRALLVTPLLLLVVSASVRADPLFSAPYLSFDAGGNPSSVAIADLNAGGRSVVVVASRAGVSALLGNGDGTFAAKTEFATGSGPISVAIADLNADGRPDLAVANFFSNTVSVLLGRGD